MVFGGSTTRAVLLSLLAPLAACGGAKGPAPGPWCATRPGDESARGVDVRRTTGRPRTALVVREGDPSAAVALAVVTDGSYASTALAALVEARMQKGGVPVESRAAGHGFRVVSLVDGPDKASEFVAAARAALAGVVIAGAPELELAARRITSLRRHPLEGAPLAAVTRCTGELGVISADEAVDPASSAGLAAIEGWRRAANVSGRIAFGAAGSSAVTGALADAVAHGGEWPNGGSPDEASAGEVAWGAYPSLGRRAGTARVRVALSVDRADEAIATAMHLGAADGALAARLSGLAVPFRLAEIAGTVRPRGGCVAATLETVRGAQGSALEDGAALAAAVTRQELEREHARFEDDPVGSSRAPGSLPLEGQRAIRTPSDPREAAELAAWWSLSERGEGSSGRLALALGLPPPPLDPRGAKADVSGPIDASAEHFWLAFQRADKSLRTPIVEHRERLERGQGEIWMLLASPCGTASEGEVDAGFAALALWGAVLSRGAEDRSITLEPWVTPDGVGLIAHAPRASFEAPSAAAARIAEHAARTLTALPLGSDALARARGTLLGFIGEGPSAEGRALAAAAGALAPGHPSWIAPLGGWDALARAGAEAASTHWATLVQGPLRLAVLANEDPAQAEMAARTVDRWIVRRADAPKSCPSAVDAPGPRSGTVPVELGAGSLGQAIVALPAPRPATPERSLAELAVAALGGSDGMLARALGTGALGATAEPRLLGGGRASALVIDIRAPESSLPAAVAQTRGVLARIRQGALTTADLERSVAVRRKWDLEASLDPRRRLVDLWKGNASPAAAPPSPTLEAWKGWAASALAEERVVVVIAKPKR